MARLASLLVLTCALLATLGAQDNFTMSSAQTLKWNSSAPTARATLAHDGILTVHGPPSEGLRRVELGQDWWCSPKSTGGFTCSEAPPIVRLGQVQSWEADEPICNCLSVDNCCGRSKLIVPTADPAYDVGPIAITPGPTTLAAPGLKVYTTFLGLPCGDAFPMPGCLPPERQGWLVQIEGGTMERFEVSFTWRDSEGIEHTETRNVPRAAPFQGKPSFTAVPFAVGRAKSAPWFPVGTEKIRTVVAEYTPKPPTVVEHEQPVER